MQPAVDMHAGADRLAHRLPGCRTQPPAVGRQTDHEVAGPVGALPPQRHRLGQAGDDRNSVRGPVQHLARVPAAVARVDDRQDAVAAGAPHQAVRGLAVGGAEGALAVDDGVPVHPQRLPVRTAT